MTEATLIKKFIPYITGRGGWAVKIHGGNMQKRGLPDILCCYRGHMVGIEVKVPGKEHTITKLQGSTLRAITSAGGSGGVVSDLDGVKALLDFVDQQIP